MKQFLTAKGVPFTTRDISEDEQAMKELERLGVAQVPVIVVDGEVVVGYDRTKLQKALGIA
ncbi:MAG: glutaredoxin family protein [Planctomycetes bacterium]|nr:glutaredoxin family protein [Planctomycetota bacterium]